MKDEELRARLSEKVDVAPESKDDVVTDLNFDKKTTDTSNPLLESATKVMISYQDANKWLDSIKETILMDLGCVFFSNYVHNLAHTMPVRFDSFGDILHTINMKIPYPATAYIPEDSTEIYDIFDEIQYILNNIEESLSEFIDSANNSGHRSAALSAENLLQDISTEYTNLWNMQRAYKMCGDLIKFDKWVAQYVNNQAALLG